MLNMTVCPNCRNNVMPGSRSCQVCGYVVAIPGGGYLLATRADRFIASLIDGFVLGAVWVVMYLVAIVPIIATSSGNGNASGIGAALGFVLFIVLGVGALVAFSFFWKTGQSIGKRAMGMYVVDLNTGRPTTGWKTFFRSVVKILLGTVASSFTFGVVGILDPAWLLWDNDRQTIHDKMMSTVVAKPVVAASPAAFPAS